MSYLDGNGCLILGAKWDEEKNSVLSGAVYSTGSSFNGYGYYEASIRFPTARGIWGAFWMMVGDVLAEDNSSEDGIELDIIESIGGDGGYCNHAVHWDGYGSNTKKDDRTHSNLDIYDGKFHTFGLWRTMTDYIFYVDGKETWRSQGGGICPLDGTIILSMEASYWAGGGTEEAIAELPAQMEVDYVRVWDTNPHNNADVRAERAVDIRLQIDNPVMTVNGVDKPVDSQGTTPVIVDGRTFLPVRAVVEEIGGTVLWDGDTRTVTLSRGEDTVKLQIGSTTAYLNDKAQALDAAPVIIGGKTMLPIRFVAESFNLDVSWDNEAQAVTIRNSAARPENYTAKTQAINIKSADNVRQLGGYPCAEGRRVKENVLFRGAMLSWLSTRDTKTLAEQYGLKYIIDLRSEKESSDDPDVEIPGAQYFSVPIYGGNIFTMDTSIKLGEIEPEDGDNMKRALAYARNGIITERYERMLLVDHVQSAYAKFFDILLSAEEGDTIIFHGEYGKDRTGIAAALLLFALGADEKMVMRDYLLTNESNVKDIGEIKAIAEANGLNAEETAELIAATKGVEEKYLVLAMESVKKEYGSIDNYLRDCLGLTDEKRKALQDKFLEK